MINKVLTGVVALSKYAQSCEDSKQWSACIDAYRNGECHAFEGCDRTCGKCVGESDCYDKIPDNHSFLFGTGGAAKAMWPNYSNQNSIPTLNIDVNDNFPFDRDAISQFCQDIFDNGLCDKSDVDTDLKLTYTDSENLDIVIDLYGTAGEYCGFTCGQCKTNTEMGECWSTHNNNMQYLAGLNSGIGGGSQIDIGFGWGDYFGDEEETWFGFDGEALDEEETDEETYDAPEEDLGGWGDNWGWSDDWGRKRRSAVSETSRGALLAEAVESLIFPEVKDMLPLNARSKRFVMDWHMAGQQASDHEEAERIKFEMEDLKCFKSMMNDDSISEEEGEEEAEEEATEEDYEDPYVRVRQQRQGTDHVGIRNWVKDNTPEGTVLDGDCEDFIVPVEEAYSEMELAYYCRIKCETGTPHVQMGEKLVLLDDQFQMKCSKARYHRFKEPAVCSASAYCVGTACNQVVCVEHEEIEYEATESEGGYEDEWGGNGGWGDDFLY